MALPQTKTVQFRGLEYHVPYTIEQEVGRVLAPYAATATVIEKAAPEPVKAPEPVPLKVESKPKKK